MHDTPVDAVQRGYESSVFGIRLIAWFSLGVVILIVATALVADWLVGGIRLPRAPVTQMPPSGQTPRPPSPMLQDAPATELRGYRQDKQAQLHAWRWVDRDAGIVQMPIETAMGIFAARSAATPTAKETQR